MDAILAIGAKISTPISLAGFLAAAFFLVVRLILQKNIFPALTRSLSASIIRIIIDRFFWLAMVGMVLGFAGFALGRLVPEPSVHKFSPPRPDMIRVSFEGGWSMDLAPQPDKKNVVIRLKVIPQTSDYTPLSSQATLVLTGTAERRYSMTLDVAPEGIPPRIKSFLAADGLLSKADFQSLISTVPPLVGRIEVEYDRDVHPGGMKFISAGFEFSSRVIEEQTK